MVWCHEQYIGPPNRPNQQIKLHLTSWQYPLINYLGPNIAACSSPLKPTGHCCYNICGAIIYIQKPWDAIDVPFNLIEAKNDMEALINPPPPRKGFSYKSKPLEFWHIISKLKAESVSSNNVFTTFLSLNSKNWALRNF